MDSVARLLARTSKTAGSTTRYITAYSLPNNVEASTDCLPYTYAKLKFDFTYASEHFYNVDIVVTNRFSMDNFIGKVSHPHGESPTITQLTAEDKETVLLRPNSNRIYSKIYYTDHADEHYSTVEIVLSMFDFMFGDVYILPYDDDDKKDKYFAPMIVPFTNAPTVLVSDIYKLHPETTTDTAQDYDNIFSANFGALSAKVCDSGRTNVLSGNAALYYNDVFSANRLITNGLVNNDDTTKISGHPVYCVDYSAFTPKELNALYAEAGKKIKLVPTDMSAYLTSATDNFGAMTTDKVAIELQEISSFDNYKLRISSDDDYVSGYMSLYRAFIYGDSEHDDEWYRTHTKLCADFKLDNVAEYWMDDTTIEPPAAAPIELHYNARTYTIVQNTYAPPVFEFSWYCSMIKNAQYFLLKKNGDRTNPDDWILVFNQRDFMRPDQEDVPYTHILRTGDPVTNYETNYPDQTIRLDNSALIKANLPELELDSNGHPIIKFVEASRIHYSDDANANRNFKIMDDVIQAGLRVLVVRLSDGTDANFATDQADGEFAIIYPYES